MAERFVAHALFPFSVAEVFRWHQRPGALERLNPPWDAAEVVEQTGGIENHGRVVLRVRVGPFRRRWIAQHLEFEPERAFHDTQIAGPFAAMGSWWHRFGSHARADSCQLEDAIDYALPGGALGRILGTGFARRKLARVFHYRHAITRQDLARHHPFREQPPLKILISGSTGLVGSTLRAFLTTGGHTVHRLVRGSQVASSGDIVWDPEQGRLDPKSLAGFDAIVHLAGENIAGGRWTAARKEKILTSRVKGTRLLCAKRSPACRRSRKCWSRRRRSVFTAIAATNFSTKNAAAAGAGFLADVCRQWEAATEPARGSGIRTVNARFGVILSARGGALPKMLLPFRLGLGGRIGNGRQWVSWVAIDDVIGALHHALLCPELSGPVNVVVPQPLTNRSYTRALAAVLHRPAIFPLPAAVARLMLGEMANELLLAVASEWKLEATPTDRLSFRLSRARARSALHLLGRAAKAKRA